MKILKWFWIVFQFVFWTILTQIGGLVFLLSRYVSNKVKWRFKLKRTVMFILVYLFSTYVLVPPIAGMFGRQRIKTSDQVRPASHVTALLNRNYVRTDLQELIQEVGKDFQSKSGAQLKITYLDANFPFMNGFPLLPHLSHNDGRKLDISFIYQDEQGEWSDQQRSNSGYGVFEGPDVNEFDQIKKCDDAGYIQYSYPQYLTFGKKNEHLEFSERGTALLIKTILASPQIQKLFIEPHLKERLNLTDDRVRYHGCGAVRHDDHIHIQIVK